MKKLINAPDDVVGEALDGLTRINAGIARLAGSTTAVRSDVGAVHAAGHVALLAGGGVATAVPLVLFGVSAIRVELSTIGLLQYLAPTIQFVLGVPLFDEPLPLVKLLGFVLVWAGLALFTVDALRHARQRRITRLEVEAAAA